MLVVAVAACGDDSDDEAPDAATDVDADSDADADADGDSDAGADSGVDAAIEDGGHDGGADGDADGDADPSCADIVAEPGLALEGVLFAEGFDRPLYVTAPVGDASRVFVVEQGGLIRVVRDGVTVEPPFLDISDRVQDGSFEQGLLGLAFHPDYENNGRFFVHYTAPIDNGDRAVQRLSEFTVSADPDVSNDDELVLLTMADQQPNHNGGMLAFGPNDGFLYVGTGDGGGVCNSSPAGSSQDTADFRGKILRYDVSTPGLLAIPGDNPFGNEVWVYGLRNPWRFSFDADNGDLYIGDVGQDALEEVDYLPADAGGGQNFGWPYYEGSQCSFDASGCEWDCAEAPAGLTAPVYEYDHDVGGAVTGGFVYRGQALPDLRGTYLFGDYSRPLTASFRIDDVAGTETTLDLAPLTSLSSFGEDGCRELYFMDLFEGTVYKLVHAP